MKQHISTVLATVALASAFTTPLAAAQQQPQTPAPAKTQANNCPALQMVVVNGTFESSKEADSNQDAGFFAQLTTPVLAAAGDESGDRSAGFTTAPTPEAANEEPPSSGVWSTPTAQKDLWGSATPTQQNPQRPEATSRTVGRTFVSYPASAGGIFMPGQQSFADSESYASSMLQGVENTRAVLRDIAAKCPETKVFLGGYSQGAQVVSEVAREIGAGDSVIRPESIAGVVLFSDPLRAEDAPIVASGASKPGAVPGTDGKAVSQLGSFVSPHAGELDGGGIGVSANGIADFGAVSGRTVSWCAPGDLVCDLPISGPLAQLVIAVAQQLDITDPQQSLVAVADALGPAVQMAGVDDVSSVNFGDGGFQLDESTAPSDSVIGEIIASSGGVENTSPRAHGAASKKESTSPWPSSASATSRTVNVAPQPVALELPLAALAPMGEALLGAVNSLGGLGLGAEIAAPLEAVRAGDLGKLAAAGLPAVMPAIESVVGSLSEVVPELLRNETATGAVGKVLENVEIMGLSGAGLAQTAAEAAGHGAAHGSYLNAAATADGLSSMQATVQWALAATADVSGRPDVARMSTDASAIQALRQDAAGEVGTDPWGGIAQGVVEGVSKAMNFDPAAAQQAMAFLDDVVKGMPK